MGLFKGESKLSLGIDIGTSAVKLVELEREEEELKLRTYGILQLPKKYFEYLKEKPLVLPFPVEDLAEMISVLTKKSKAESKKAYFSIPVYSSFSCVIEIPNIPEEEIASAVTFEAKKYIPVPISDLVLDWSIIPFPSDLFNKEKRNSILNLPAKDKAAKTDINSQKIQVLLVAVPKETIYKYNKISELCNIKIKGLEAEIFSLARSLIGKSKDGIVLVDSGARSTNISIIDGGYIRVTHNLEKGGAQITELISQKMNISIEDAEELKKKGVDSEVRSIIYSVYDSIISEIKKIIYSYENKYSRKIEKCVLAGAGTDIVGIREYLERRLERNTIKGKPFSRIVYPSILNPAIEEIESSLAVAVGVAMK